MLRFYNTLTRQLEKFSSLNPPKVGMYACGPTVYDYMHIGNLRTFILSDLLHRVFLASGYQVTVIENITDIDDKIIKKAKEKNITLDELTAEYTQYFIQDLNKLNILPAHVNPKATEHVGAMTKYIEELIEKGFAYVESDGSVYFDISKFPDYGKLSRLDKRSLKTGTRILSDEYTKEDVQDFALWKTVDSGEIGFDSPWGKGRPGWHIECSVMSQKYLGKTFDVHVGGVDLMFPHHENEIAQSEAKTGKKFVNYFIHGEHLLVEGQKMSKSLGNFYRLKDLEEKGFDPLSFRYLVMTAHYRDKLNFTWESLGAAQRALDNIRQEIRAWEQPKIGCAEFEQRFFESVNSDLNTPQAIAVMWDLIKSDYPTSSKARSILEMDKILGLKLEEYLGRRLEIPAEVRELVEKREKARQSHDFEKADQIRKQVESLGFEIEDTASGSKIKSNR